MLKQRIITALVLLAILLPALFSSSSWPLTALALLLMVLGSWEWGRLNGCGPVGAWSLGGLCLLICLLVWQFGALPLLFAATGQWVWVVAGTAWVLLSAGMLRQGVPGWSRWPVMMRLLGGVAVLCLAWLAVAQAHQMGVNFLLSVLALVWAADIGAYFAGRAYGTRWFRNKLAPAISPGKSWEGVVGGVLAALLLALVWIWVDTRWSLAQPSFYSQLYRAGPVPLVLGVLLMCAMSVVGDLVESLVKRSAGFKDSSGLLPGHGGVLDRLDALLPTLPLALMLLHLTARPWS